MSYIAINSAGLVVLTQQWPKKHVYTNEWRDQNNTGMTKIESTLTLLTPNQKNCAYYPMAILKSCLICHFTKLYNCVVGSLFSFLSWIDMCLIFFFIVEGSLSSGRMRKKVESSKLKSNDGVKENFDKERHELKPGELMM